MANKKTSTVRVAGRTLTLSNLDKVLYPKTKTTKGEVIAYYARVAKTILPHVRARPLTLKRYPSGVDGPFFYEKMCPSHRPDWIETKKVPRTSRPDDNVNYCVLTDEASLVWVANLASIELHVLLSHAKDVMRPTAIAFDFDPGPGCTLVDCAWAALEVRALFDAMGLKCFPKSSGKKGLHVYVPLNTPVTFEQTKPFAQAVALLLERRYPDRIVSKMGKHLRAGKIFVDWSQNDDHKTTVAPYSLRANEAPTVSAPLEWDEVERAFRKKDGASLVFTADEVLRRIEKKGDLFSPVLTLKQKLPEAAHLAAASAPAPAKDAAQATPPAKKKKAARPRRSPKTAQLLREYDRKRDFKITPEPAGDSGDEDDAPRFVIQKHAASHLHYDFRLESRGVLKSWAVPKGLSTDTSVKRLAMMTEDHPMDYAGFEGVIPEGEYGGGAVMVWDAGTFVNLTQKNGKLIPFEAGLAKGHVDFWLKGRKLKGAWSLVKIGDDRRRWIVHKKADAAAGGEEPVVTQPDSILTGRSIERIRADRTSRVWHSNR